MRHVAFALAVLLAAPISGGAVAQDVQTANDWATGAAHGAVIDSINRENVKRLRGKARTRPSQATNASPTNRRWTAAERETNCSFLRAHLHRLNAKQLRDYKIACR